MAGGGDDDNIPAASGSPDASLTQDDSFTATSHAGLTYPWGEAAPGAGEVIRIADGIGWARIPMPGSLGHINSWLLDDDGGVAVVDTGICLTMCSDAWKALYAGALKDARITRVFGTHLHPDHIGLAGWIAKKHEVKLWMTRGEMLTARAIVADSSDTAPAEVLAQSRAAGWDAAALEELRTRGWNMFQQMIFALPRSYVRIVDGQRIDSAGIYGASSRARATAPNTPACGPSARVCSFRATRSCRGSVRTCRSTSPSPTPTRWANGWRRSTS